MYMALLLPVHCIACVPLRCGAWYFQYLKPVIGDIVATASVEPAVMDTFLEELVSRGKGRVEVPAGIEHEGKLAVKFSAVLYARLR